MHASSQRQELLYDKGQASYETQPLTTAGTDNLDMPLVEEYANAVGAPDPSGGVSLTLLAEPLDRELDSRLSDRARAAMGALRDGGRLSTGEVAEALGVSRPVAQKELVTLRDEGVIEWVGKSPRDPRAYWRLRPT